MQAQLLKNTIGVVLKLTVRLSNRLKQHTPLKIMMNPSNSLGLSMKIIGSKFLLDSSEDRAREADLFLQMLLLDLCYEILKSVQY